ncbi:peptidase M50 [Methanocella sp. CWC-04]|uniref:Peptidase M50 n=1 Tax=Methanooceanicella nereidis TaxID=2052831 RepID=A0AAP2RBQ2_9EURY|nr:site-2 protease family protein [Methanocella sp. CWC-04]MCD1294574.1 peptidase M50 [Methanocella sp. CWC-04]
MVDFIWAIVIIGFALWWIGVDYLKRAGILEKYNISTMGPILMCRTFRGQGLLDLLSRPKTLWKAIITLCIPFIVFSMIFMLFMIITVDVLMIIDTPEPGMANAPQNILAIPGVNEFIPFLWGWIALFVAMVVHEFGHAILSKVENIKVKSLGLLLAPIPVGAFAELDEEELFGTKTEGAKGEILGPMDTASAKSGKRKANSMQLIRILGAGVITNFLVAIIAFLLLFYPVLGAIAATNTDMVVVNVAADSPAGLAGMQKNMIIQSVDGKNITSSAEFNEYVRSMEGSTISIAGLQGKKPVSYEVPVGNTSGVYILGVLDGYPGKEAGLQPNMRLIAINGTPIADSAAYTDYMANTTAGQTVTLTVVDKDGNVKDISLSLAGGTEPKGYIGFSGADLSDNPLGIAVGKFMAENHLNMLRELPNSIGGWLLVLFLPVWEVSGDIVGFGVFQSDLASLYHPVGWAEPFGNGVFYLALSLFWIGWLNLNIGLFNCLPMVPLDGGHIFREATRIVVGRFVKDDGKVERISRTIVNGFAITLFTSIIFMIVAPYIVHGLM